MLDIKQLDKYVVKPTLEFLGMDSLAARRLMIGTALAESRCEYIHQVNGPALGLWQVEPATWADNYKNFLDFNSRIDLKKKFLGLRGSSFKYELPMIGNLNYNCAHARLKYWRSPNKLPNQNDFKAMADYHKEIYNSACGKADAKVNMYLFERACKEIK